MACFSEYAVFLCLVFLTNRSVITSYSIHYTKLYEKKGEITAIQTSFFVSCKNSICRAHNANRAKIFIKSPSLHDIMIQRILLCVLASIVFPLTNVSASIVDRSVAIVNNDTITLSEVNELGQSYFKKVTEETPPDRLADALYQARRTVIEKLIDRKLMVQEAKKLNIQVSDQDVDGAIP